MELLISIVYHVFYIFLVQGLLYLFYASQLEKTVVNNFIADKLYDAISQSPDLKALAQVVLPLVRFPQTCITYDNANWRHFLYMFLIIAFLVTLTMSLIMYILTPEVPILHIAMWNLAIFAIIAVVEFIFFKSVIMNYSEVSIKDILDTINAALQTDPNKKK